jgi:hypothetical protein
VVPARRGGGGGGAGTGEEARAGDGWSFDCSPKAAQSGWNRSSRLQVRTAEVTRVWKDRPVMKSGWC